VFKARNVFFYLEMLVKCIISLNYYLQARKKRICMKEIWGMMEILGIMDIWGMVMLNNPYE